MMKAASLLRVGAKAASAPFTIHQNASASYLLLDNYLQFPPRNNLIYYKRNFCTTNKLNILGNSSVEATIPNIGLVKEKLQKIMGLEKGYSPLLPSRGHLAQYLPTQQDELPSRTMQDSFSSTIIPLSTDINLQEKYSTFLGQVRLGRLMEDMDTFAAWVAHSHIYNPKVPADTPTPYVIVTVLVDQIDFTDVIPKPDADIRLSGHVSWVGRSSIETVVWLEQKIHDKWTKITRALFLMAARNPTNSKAAIVNSLVPGNEEEQKILEGGESRKRRRQNATAKSLLKVIPDQEEQGVIHDLFLKTLDARDPSFRASHLPPGAMWMKAAQMDNLVFSHPEDRNLHQKVFGGFLMRQAFELSWACGWVFSKQRPTLMHISDIMFHKSVDVSSLIKMRAQIVYTELHYMQIVVNAEVFDAKTGAVSTTNVFHYTYKINDEAPQIIPKSYHESMLYLDGKRHFQRVMGLK